MGNAVWVEPRRKQQNWKDRWWVVGQSGNLSSPAGEDFLLLAKHFSNKIPRTYTKLCPSLLQPSQGWKLYFQRTTEFIMPLRACGWVFIRVWNRLPNREAAASNPQIPFAFMTQATVAESAVLCGCALSRRRVGWISSVVLGRPRSLSHPHPGVGMASRLHLWCQLLLIIVIAWSAVLRRIERPHTGSEVIN